MVAILFLDPNNKHKLCKDPHNDDKAKKKICVFTVTRPTLIFASDPMHFYTEFG